MSVLSGIKRVLCGSQKPMFSVYCVVLCAMQCWHVICAWYITVHGAVYNLR